MLRLFCLFFPDRCLFPLDFIIAQCESPYFITSEESRNFQIGWNLNTSKCARTVSFYCVYDVIIYISRNLQETRRNVVIPFHYLDFGYCLIIVERGSYRLPLSYIINDHYFYHFYLSHFHSFI